MIELDYAFLCEYATVSQGALTAVNASFTSFAVPSIPTEAAFSLAGRVRVDAQTTAVPIEISVSSPGGDVRMGFSGALSAEGFAEYDGKKGIVFAVNIRFPVRTTGLHVLVLSLDGKEVRTLKFDLHAIG